MDIRSVVRMTLAMTLAVTTLASSIGVAAAQSAGSRLVVFDPLGSGFNPVDVNAFGHLAGVLRRPDREAMVVIWRDGLYEELGPLGEGTIGRMNDRHQVVGNAGTGPAPRAYLWERGGGHFLEEAADSFGGDVNNRGVAVGATIIGGVQMPTVWSAKGTTYIGLGFATAINKAGHVAGSLGTAVALWRDGAVIPIASGNGYPTAMNDDDQVAFFLSVSGQAHAYLWDAGRTVELVSPAASIHTMPNDINRAGSVVGTYIYLDENGVGWSRALLWHNHGRRGHEVLDINTMLRPEAVAAGWVLNDATRINDHGAIIGRTYNKWCTPDCLARWYLLEHSPLPDQLPEAGSSR